MPMQQGKSPLMAKYGEKFRNAANAHAGDEVDIGNMELPAGIEGGIARIDKCRFQQVKAGKANAGEWMFFADAVVVSPAEHAGVRTRGLRTMISEVIAETPNAARKTVEDHVAHIQKLVKPLCGPGDPQQYSEQVNAENLEATVKRIQEEQPHFRFRTWRGGKQVLQQTKSGKHAGKWQLYDQDENGGTSVNIRNADKAWPTLDMAKKANPFAGRDPRVQHQWCGYTEYSGDEGDAGAGVTDGTGSDQSSGSTSVMSNGEAGEEDTTTTPNQQFEEFSLEELAAMAGGEPANVTARKKLQEAAMAAGLTEEDVDSAASWEDVVEMINNATGGNQETGDATGEGEEEPAAEEGPPVPAKGEVWLYHPMDPKTKKPQKKGVQCQVLAVDESTGTCTLKNLDQPKVQYKNVKLDALEPA